ncbi:MAG TPA: low-specificity L-threonine aldolase [Anaerolineales bacterium]|nr:low-specificity L-threonine aldolase [Anaerolineales bacterium]
MEYIDLRSDTVTKPTPEMREAMAKAEVGDDVFGDDPTVNRLQEMAAGMIGKDAGLFVASGTMGNLAALLAHCQRGDEVIIGQLNHSFLFEAGGMSVLGGISSFQLKNQPDGSLLPEEVEAAIRPDDPHDPITRLVCLENTHNRCGGTFQTAEYTQMISKFAHDHGLKVHLDGARIFNAAAALGIPARELAKPVDSVTFCLSKGLSAPVGSVLCGDREFIRKAKRARKLLGGGMRQAGVLAAAGIVALEKMVPRLGEDHLRAHHLADGLRANDCVVLDPGTPATNMVFFNLAPHAKLSAPEIEDKLKKQGVLVSASSPRRFRLVTHCWIDDAAVEKAVSAFASVLH